MNRPPPNPSSFPDPDPSPNPNPNFFHSHLHHNPPTTTSHYPHPLPPADDLLTACSTLKDLILLSESTISSISTLLHTKTTTTDGLGTCPFNPHHRVPPDFLFRHSLQCPSSPATVDLTLLELLHYPNTLQSSDELIKRQNRFIQTTHNFDAELCFSLDEYGDFGSNFFYRDCPGVVSSVDRDGTNRMLTLPGVLSAECANFVGSGDREVKGFSKECLGLLPSELWVVNCETRAWNDYPTLYSCTVLRAILCSETSKDCHLLRWIIVNSPSYGVVIDVPMRDHILLLFRLCVKAITREAIVSAELVFSRDMKDLDLKTKSFKCPILVQVLMWLTSQLSVLYGEVNGRLFAVDMLKQFLSSASLNSSYVQIDNESASLKELNGKQEDKSIEYQSCRVAAELEHSRVIFVSQVAAAVAALHERSLLEEKIKAIREQRPLTCYQRLAEHAYVSKIADEERQKRSNYRPIIEHDGLLWQRSYNQETNKMKTREELLAEERDYKRRRMSYRGKKSKRTATQVMRDIIEEYTEEIRQAAGINCLTKGAEDPGRLASEPRPVHDTSTDNLMQKSLAYSSEVSIRQQHGYRKQLHSHNDFRSRRVEDESPEDNKRCRPDSHWRHGHPDARRSSGRDRHDREYYSRSPDSQRTNGLRLEQINNWGHQDDAELSRKNLPRSPDRSYSRSHEQSSHRRDRVDQIPETKDRRRRSTHKNLRLDSAVYHEFEDRYDPSESRDMYADNLDYVGLNSYSQIDDD